MSRTIAALERTRRTQVVLPKRDDELALEASSRGARPKAKAGGAASRTIPSSVAPVPAAYFAMELVQAKRSSDPRTR